FPYSTNQNVTSVGGACGTASGDTPTVSVAVTGGSTQNGTTPCSGGNWTYTLTTPLSAVGAYNVTATQTDAVGNTGTSGAQSISIALTAPVVTLTPDDGPARSFPYSTNQTVTTVAGACGAVSGDIATVSVAVTGGSTQNGTTACVAGNWT